MCNTCYRNTTNTTGGCLGQLGNGLFGCCRCQQNTVTVPIYGTVTIPLNILQGTTGENTQNTQNGCGCQNTCHCHHHCRCRRPCGNGCLTTCSGDNGYGNTCGNTRCGRGVATSIITGDTDSEGTTEIRYGYYPQGYASYAASGCGCGR